MYSSELIQKITSCRLRSFLAFHGYFVYFLALAEDRKLHEVNFLLCVNIASLMIFETGDTGRTHQLIAHLPTLSKKSHHFLILHFLCLVSFPFLLGFLSYDLCSSSALQSLSISV